MQDEFDKANGVLTIEPGIHEVGSVKIGPNVQLIRGYGATLKMKPNAGEFNRILNITNGRLIIEGLCFDMNRDNQSWKGGHDLEHQAGIFAQSCDLIVRDCVFKNSAADGLYVHHNARVIVEGCRAEDCFRGGIVITGDNSVVDITNYTSVRGRAIDIEPNDKNHKVDVRLNGVRAFESMIDLGVLSGNFVANNIQSDGVVSILCTDGRCKISNSQLSTLNVDTVGSIEIAGSSVRSANVVWNRGSYKSGQVMVFSDCALDGIYCGVDKRELNNQLIVNNCVFNGSAGIGHDRGGNWLIQNCWFNVPCPYKLKWTTGFYYDMIFNGNTFGPKVQNYWDSFYDHPENRVTHMNTMIDASMNNFKTDRGMYRLGANQYRGSRVINGFSPASGPGLVGDVYVSGQEKWVCTRGDYTKADWKLMDEPLPVK